MYRNCLFIRSFSLLMPSSRYTWASFFFDCRNQQKGTRRREEEVVQERPLGRQNDVPEERQQFPVDTPASRRTGVRGGTAIGSFTTDKRLQCHCCRQTRLEGDDGPSRVLELQRASSVPLSPFRHPRPLIWVRCLFSRSSYIFKSNLLMSYILLYASHNTLHPSCDSPNWR